MLLILRSFVNLFKFYKLTFTKLATPTGKFAGLFFFWFCPMLLIVMSKNKCLPCWQNGRGQSTDDYAASHVTWAFQFAIRRRKLGAITGALTAVVSVGTVNVVAGCRLLVVMPGRHVVTMWWVATNRHAYVAVRVVVPPTRAHKTHTRHHSQKSRIASIWVE